MARSVWLLNFTAGTHVGNHRRVDVEPIEHDPKPQAIHISSRQFLFVRVLTKSYNFPTSRGCFSKKKNDPLMVLFTPPKTNECPLKRWSFQKETVVFQPLFFKGHSFVFRGIITFGEPMDLLRSQEVRINGL